jgi:hypothetical protein
MKKFPDLLNSVLEVNFIIYFYSINLQLYVAPENKVTDFLRLTPDNFTNSFRGLKTTWKWSVCRRVGF